MDVRDEQSVSAGVEHAHSGFGGFDVLVKNELGIGMRTVRPDFMTSPQGFWQVSPEGFRDLFATNVVGDFLVARAVAPYMLQAGHGKIVNISVSETTMRRRASTPTARRGHDRCASDIMAADCGTGIDVKLLLPAAHQNGMTPDSAPAHCRPPAPATIMGPPICWLASRASTA